MSNDNLLHIYGQNSEHDDVWIVGNREALRRLSKALVNILFHHGAVGTKQSIKDVMTADGEGYEIHIIRNDSTWTEDYWRNLGLPYSSPSSQDMRNEAIWPWDKEGEKP